MVRRVFETLISKKRNQAISVVRSIRLKAIMEEPSLPK
jgi:hypothetical protein